MSKSLKVAFAGVPGSGKTSTARAFAGMCGTETSLKKVELISEYAREYIALFGSLETLADQVAVSMTQINLEERALVSNSDIMVTDSPVYLGWLYTMYMTQKTKRDAMYASHLFSKFCELNIPPRYDIVFHLPPIIPPVDDNVRKAQHLDDGWRKEADSLIPFIFKLFPPIRFIRIESCSLFDRVSECLGHLRELMH
jgi:nicotinamide riboside kinase